LAAAEELARSSRARSPMNWLNILLYIPHCRYGVPRRLAVSTAKVMARIIMNYRGFTDRLILHFRMWHWQYFVRTPVGQIDSQELKEYIINHEAKVMGRLSKLVSDKRAEAGAALLISRALTSDQLSRETRDNLLRIAVGIMSRFSSEPCALCGLPEFPHNGMDTTEGFLCKRCADRNSN
jgi:hypothetical protein